MAEQVIQVEQALRKGLRARVGDKRGVDLLVTCDYLKPGEYGLEPFITPTSPVSSAELTAKSITVNSSGPQYFRGNQHSYVLEPTKLWELNESTGILTQITTFDFTNQELPKAIPTGQLWQGYDRGDFWLSLCISCGVSCCVVKVEFLPCLPFYSDI